MRWRTMPSSSLMRALVLGERGGLGAEARDDVVAGLAAADRVGELAAAPVIHLEVARSCRGGRGIGRAFR